MTLPALKVLLSGPGLIGQKHLSLLKDNPNTVVSAIVAPNRDANIAIASAYGVRLYESMETALSNCDVDAAIISSPNQFHCEQVLSCLEYKVPVFVEKPIADSLRDAHKIVESSKENNVPVLVGHHRTYSPLLLSAKEYITSSDFGSMVAFYGSALFHKPADYFETAPWRSQIGGGPILINMIHEIGIIRHLCGEILSVSATLSNKNRRFAVEDSAAISFRMSNGAVGTFLLSDAACSNKSWEMTAGENPVYPFYGDENCYHFAGSNGSLDFPSMRCRTYSGALYKSWWTAFVESRLSVRRADPLERQIIHFVDVVRGITSPLVSAADGYANLRTLHAIIESSRQSREVMVEEISE